MARIAKLKTGKWIAEVRRKVGDDSFYKSETFNTKLEAISWSANLEQRVAAKGFNATGKTVGDAMRRYQEEICPTKKGERWEIIRLKKLLRQSIADYILSDLTPEDITRWIKTQTISPASVRRELGLISSVLKVARVKWKWISQEVMRDVDKPRKSPPRDRRINQEEIDRVLLALGYEENEPIRTKRQQLAVAFLLALETAMRQGEIWNLEWPDIFLNERYLTLHDTKNGTRRNVPLNKRAVQLLEKMEPAPEGNLFSFPQASAEVIFRRSVMLTGIDNLHFHDTRHEALTRLARKLDVLDLARMVGHKDPRSLMIYYNATASEIASRLD
jgi:integrase